MDIHLDFVPGETCWVMDKNLPVQLKVDSVSIVVGLDYSKKNITVGSKYHLAMGAYGGDYDAKDICHTKQELKEKVFG